MILRLRPAQVSIASVAVVLELAVPAELGVPVELSQRRPVITNVCGLIAANTGYTSLCGSQRENMRVNTVS